MTLPDRALRWWHLATRRLARPAGAVAPDRSHSRVPADYLSLHTYLEHRYATEVVLTFTQIETLLGLTLPPAARTEPGWWTAPDAGERGARHSDAWVLARRTATPNLGARTVLFERHA